MIKEKVILLCHGKWGESLLIDVKKHFGLFGNYEVLPLNDDVSTSTYMEELKENIKGHDVILLTDLFPGSSSSIAIRVALSEHVQALTGLSLQTLLMIDTIWCEEGFHKIVQHCDTYSEQACIDLVARFNKHIREEK